MRIAFLGLGLIGGSVARAIRGATDAPWQGAEIAAWTPQGDGPRRALAAGTIDEASASTAEAVRGADLVVLAGDSVDLYNPKTIRASVGSLFHVPVLVERDAEAAVDRMLGP